MDDSPRYPKRILRILSKWHVDAVTPDDCAACSSSCCSHGGFAILENVLKIFDLYQEGKLGREDYEFQIGLSFRDFVETYFDVLWYPTGRWFRSKHVAAFFMKSLSSDNHLISIPAVGNSYHRTRSKLFNENPWLNKGCVFLNKKVGEWPFDDRDSSRQCILHDAKAMTHLTQKPIDCVFFVCTRPHELKIPTKRISARWFRALAVSYPDSVQRFRSMVEEEKEAN